MFEKWHVEFMKLNTNWKEFPEILKIFQYVRGRERERWKEKKKSVEGWMKMNWNVNWIFGKVYSRILVLFWIPDFWNRSIHECCWDFCVLYAMLHLIKKDPFGDSLNSLRISLCKVQSCVGSWVIPLQPPIFIVWDLRGT